MKNLDLNAYGVEEMSKKQLQEVEGGFGILAFMGIIALAICIITFFQATE